jgi:hypothetical protein
MILEKQTEANVLTEGVSQSSIGMSLDLDSAQVLMQMLSKNLYSDSIGSTIRECASNALDSHRRAGVDKPIIVSFKRNDANNYEFSVEDFGIGLDAEDVENIISKYGKSTKRDSNTELGMMGLGFKAPLAYCSSFYFVCRKNGVERKYMMYEGEENNTIDLLYQVNTDMGNGVKVIIPVKYYDKFDFVSKTKEQLAYFESVYFDFMDEDIKNDFVIFRGEHFQFSELATDSKMHICLDNVYYPMDFEKLGISDALYFPIALRFSLTDGLFPTPNRESLRYTQEAKQIILNKLKLVADYFVGKYNEAVEEGNDIHSVLDYLWSSDRHVSSFNKNYNINRLIPYASKTPSTPKLDGVKKLDLVKVFQNRDWWLSEYTAKVQIQRGGARNLENRYCSDWNPRGLKDIKVYVYDSLKLSGVKKDYIKSITLNRDSAIIVRKDGEFKLDRSGSNYKLNYYRVLELENYPVSDWRDMIKEFQYITSLLTADFINLDDLVVPQSFLDSRKKVKAVSSTGQVVGRKIKLAGEIVGKQAVELQRYVDGKNCKWESTTYKLETLHKSGYLTIYGSQDNVEMMDKLYSVIPRTTIRFVQFSDRELENVKKLKIHNWMSYDEFIKGENAVFKRTITAYLVRQLKSTNQYTFDRTNNVKKVSLSLYNKIKSLNSYVIQWYVSGGSADIYTTMLKIAEEKNLFDMITYQTYLDVKAILERLPFFNYLIGKSNHFVDSGDVAMNCLVDLCKYHKFKLDIKNYKNNIVEEESTEEEED